MSLSIKVDHMHGVSKLVHGGIVLSALGALCLGCGGGSDGDGGDARSVGGTWRGSATLVENTCGFTPAPTFTFTQVVNQNGEAIVLTDSSSNTQFVGNLVGEDGFSVDATGSQGVDNGGNVTCNFADRAAYDDINDDDDSNATVRFTSSGTCSSGNTCVVRYDGVASRSGVPSDPTAGPVATAAPTSAPGKCASLQSRTYSGDGDCGIGSTTVKSNSDTNLVLEPFGINGATGFIGASGTSTTFDSTRTDLTINGIAGYSCAIQCAPPLTFRIECFKEGGSSCSEKF